MDFLRIKKSPLVTFTFFTPLDKQKTSYENLKRKLIANVHRNGHLDDGLLLESKEKGVIYPLIHCAPFYGKSLNETRIYSNEYLLEQGCYQELASIEADLFGQSLDDVLRSASLLGSSPTNWTTFHLVVGFKQMPTSPFRDIMESDWKDWTGARYLYLNLPDEFGLLRLTFYKRKSLDEFHLFLYVLIAECVHVTNKRRIFIKDFVQRMRADKMPPYLALYEEEKEEDRGVKTGSSAFSVRRRRSFESQSPSPVSVSWSSSSEEKFVNGHQRTSSPLFGAPIPLFRTTFTFSSL